MNMQIETEPEPAEFEELHAGSQMAGQHSYMFHYPHPFFEAVTGWLDGVAKRFSDWGKQGFILAWCLVKDFFCILLFIAGSSTLLAVILGVWFCVVGGYKVSSTIIQAVYSALK